MAVKNKKLDVDLKNPSIELLIRNGLKASSTSDRRNRLHARDTYCGRRNAILAGLVTIQESNMVFQLYTEFGKTVEKIVIKGLQNSGSLLYEDFIIPSVGINLGGRIDAIAVVDKKVRILEIKNIGELPDKPKGSHIAQTKTYSAICGLPYSIIYVSRKVQRREGYDVVPDMTTFNYPFNLSEAKEHIFDVVRSDIYKQNGFLPPKLHRFKVQCEHCDFKSFCFHGVANSLITLKEPTPDDELKLLTDIEKLTEEITKPENVKLRRNFVLTQIASKNKTSKKILEKLDWDEIA